MGKNRKDKRSFIFGDKTPSKLVETIYKTVVVFLWALIYMFLFGLLTVLIDNNIESYSTVLLIKACYPLVYILAVLTMKKLMRDDFSVKIKVDSIRELFKYMALVIVLILFAFLFVLFSGGRVLSLRNIFINPLLYVSIVEYIFSSIGYIYLFVGYIYQIIKRNYGKNIATIATSLIYGVLLVINGLGFNEFIPLLNEILWMIVFILIYENSKTMGIPMIASFLYMFLHRHILGFSKNDSALGTSLFNLIDKNGEVYNWKYGANNLIIVAVFLVALIFYLYKFDIKGESDDRN